MPLTFTSSGQILRWESIDIFADTEIHSGFSQILVATARLLTDPVSKGGSDDTCERG